jgi:hypothetical protein
MKKFYFKLVVWLVYKINEHPPYCECYYCRNTRSFLDKLKDYVEGKW